MRLLLIGYGKMGRTLEQLATQRGHEIVGTIDVTNHHLLSTFTGANVDAAIEFTHPESAFNNVSYCLRNNIPVVCGSTGWLDRFAEATAICEANQGAFFYASNYSVGVNLFFHFNEYVARKMQDYPHFQVSVKEIHHTQKVDKPSGTAITVVDGIQANYPGKQGWLLAPDQATDKISITSDRIGNVVGTHIVRYESENDTIELMHDAHSRTGFAEGAVMAAEWLQNKKGVFGMKDMLNL
ncbi:4-hydroxy-tetrahydrodipicolinate reductase [Adhaeribacter pallidiroseus]|uniref:4-hydroxy-tetrahydrodipicolinate reductase n=1 Tax=Adhaeribacter pallidiroseus TaxID=2072847 RepID=A0A369QMN1_9BACT|nr:4-hydroxy-tetrahydrodipicolinate reductase [Adhaeribacter pallidiroseus]RDC63478.1 4-hydroxy-tetrahydrodipicolinate reductase [Adhaeribacter pallidiroseus]